MLRKLTAFFFCLLLIPCAQAERLRIAAEGNYKPFSYTNEDGRLVGFDVDIAYALCAQMKVECEVEFLQWADLIPALESNRIDVAVASMARTPERAKRVDFTDHYYSSHSIFAGLPGRVADISPASLKGKRVAVIGQTIQAEFMLKHYPETQVQLVQHQEQAFDLLLKDEIDFVLSDSINLLNFLQRPEASRFEFINESLQNNTLQVKAHMAVHKGNVSLQQQLNRALEEIRLNGVYDNINRRYFPFSVY